MLPCVAGYLRQLLAHLEEIKYGELASVTGRYYAMDRDKRFERIKIAYDGLVHGEGHVVDSAADVPGVSKRTCMPVLGSCLWLRYVHAVTVLCVCACVCSALGCEAKYLMKSSLNDVSRVHRTCSYLGCYQ